MSYKVRYARRVWREVLPFGILSASWGLANLWLFTQLDATTVIQAEIAMIWKTNIVLALVGGLAGALYLTVRLRRQAALLEELVEAMPCAVLVGGPRQKIECCNSKAAELIGDGMLKEMLDRKNWRQGPVEYCGMTFPGLYSLRGMHIAVQEKPVANKRDQLYGNILVFVDVTQFVASNSKTMELAQILRELNAYLAQTNDAFVESTQALASSALHQALAFQELVDCVYSVASDVEADAVQIKEKMERITGDVDQRVKSNREQLEKLNESAVLMHKTHEAAKLAAARFAQLQNGGEI